MQPNGSVTRYEYNPGPDRDEYTRGDYGERISAVYEDESGDFWVWDAETGWRGFDSIPDAIVKEAADV